MKTLKWFAFGFVACFGLTTTTTRAAEDSVLNQIPRDAVGFIHVHVGDLWKHDSFQSVRDLLTKTEPSLMRGFEKEVGFTAADVDTLTVIFPEIDERAGPAPLFLIRMNKPFDKAKLLTAMRAQTPGQMRHGEFGGAIRSQPSYAPRPKMMYPPKDNIPKSMKESDKPDKKFLPPKKPLPTTTDFEEILFFAPMEVTEEPESFSESASSPRVKPNLTARYYILADRKMHLFIVDERTILLGEGRDAPGGSNPLTAFCLQLLRRAEKGPLDLAVAEAAKKKTIVAGINMVEVAKSVGKLPPEGARFRSLFSAKSAVLSLNVAEEMGVVLTVEAVDADGAKKIEDDLGVLIGLAKEFLPDLKKEAKKSATSELWSILLDQGEKALAKVAIERKGALVQATTSVKADVAFQTALKAAIAQVQVAAARSVSQNFLKQMGLALHSFHDANGFFPFPGIGKKGVPNGVGVMNPNLSWRVAILPYIEQGNLFQQFKLDEPWDSGHNKKLIEKMPKIFAPLNGVKAEKGHTFYQIFTGREALFAGMRIPASFPDGTSNTIAIVESGDSVPWTRPEDMLYDSKKPLPKLGGLFDGDFNALFVDGSVRWIRKSVAEKTLRALITPSGGEVIDWGDLDE